MKTPGWIVAGLAVFGAVTLASAGVVTNRFDLVRIGRKLQGEVVDHTHNHGADRRIWSAALCQKRDLYVYLPPCYDPSQKYPLVFWFHQGREDEADFLTEMAPVFDRAIACGLLPPMIIAAPDGSVRGHVAVFTSGSFFLNSRAGNFEDYIIQDVYSFVLANYPIRPEREAHVLMGASMGGFAAFNLGIKHRDQFGVAIGFCPPVNLRWVDCHGHYLRNFDPCCWGWRTKFPLYEVIGRLGPIPVMTKHFVVPLYGFRRDLAEPVSRDNPIEMLEAYDVMPGQLDMFIGYGGRDELNIDAQVESFLYVARARGLDVGVAYDPKAGHGIRTVWKQFDQMAGWLAPRLVEIPHQPNQ